MIDILMHTVCQIWIEMMTQQLTLISIIVQWNQYWVTLKIIKIDKSSWLNKLEKYLTFLLNKVYFLPKGVLFILKGKRKSFMSL